VSAVPGNVDIQVNGKPRQVATGTTVAALIAELGLAGKPVAVEKNREIVPKAEHATTTLAAGDRLELVTFVGGG
jgi:sulfur carrier protein